MKRRLLWVGDAAVSSGFAKSTHRILDVLQLTFDVHVLGLNYHGDPHTYPYPIYPCYPGGDMFGLGRLKEMLQKHGPSVIVVQNDPWNFQAYLKRINGNVPVVGVVAVDGKNCRGKQLNGLALAVFWTRFGEEQAKLGGYTGPSTVIPLGVDLETFKPSADKAAVRERMSLPKILSLRGLPPETFIVGVVGRNQHRKRLDLTIEYFSHWVHKYQVNDAVLWLHVAPTGERAYDLEQLAEYYNISNRIVIPDIDERHGVTEDLLARLYNAFDVMMTTTQGEGFGLPCLEGMACGTPQIVPDWAALGEWTDTAAYKIPCSTTAATVNGINAIGGIADRDKFVQALDFMYRNRVLREQHHDRGLQLVQKPEFRWQSIGENFNGAIERMFCAPSEIEMETLA